jgi:uncharacterized protein YfaS (alpha-2-macroglobulin family)
MRTGFRALLLLSLAMLAACHDATGAAATSSSPASLAMSPHADPPVPAIDTASVFDSLAPPHLATDAGAQPFQEAVKPLPRAGERALPFPPAEVRAPPHVAAVPVGPLQVVRHQPDGAVGLTGAVTVTFNQPMVPLTSIEALRQLPVPLRLQPEPPGAYRWLDATTILFEPTDRMPFGTRYTATVPAGTKSHGGSALAQPFSFTFETPRPKVEAFEPADAHDVLPDPVLHLAFNQRVAPEAVATGLRCVAGGKRYALKVDPTAMPAELASDASSDAVMQRRTFIERNVYLKPTEKLPLDAEVTCVLPRGFVGAEGPQPSAADQSFTFRTYGPLQLTDLRCQWSKECPPGTPLQAVFNNALAEDQDLTKLLTVEPAVADLQFEGQGGYITLSGSFAAETTYRFTFHAALRDTHGQTLGRDVIRSLTIGPAQAQLSLSGAQQVVLERHGPRLLPLSYSALTKGRLRYFKIEPTEVLSALGEVNRYYRPDEAVLPGRKPSIDRAIDFGARSNESAARGLDIDEVTGKDGSGLFIVDVSSEELRKGDRYSSTHKLQLVQVTDLGVTAHVTEEKAVVLVTSFQTGKPVSGATVKVIDAKGKLDAVGKTDAHGLCELQRPQDARGEQRLIVAQKDDDRAVLLSESPLTGDFVSLFNGGSNDTTLTSSVFTDRSPYRPGDTVHVAGVLRATTHGPKGAVVPLPAGTAFSYRFEDARGQKINEGKGQIGALGLFSVDLALAKDAVLGRTIFRGTIERNGITRNDDFSTYFDVEEFRTPEYKVALETGEGSHFTHEALHGTVVGEYYFGGGMAGAPASWQLSRSPATFRPPGAPEGFTFGKEPEFIPYGFYGRFNPRSSSESVTSGEGILDGRGKLTFETPLDPGANEGPVSFSLEAQVTDASRQQITASSTVLAHAAQNYVGVRLDRSVIKAGESLGVELIVDDLDGKPQPTTGITVELVRRTWTRPKGRGPAELKEEMAASCTPRAPGTLGDAATCRIAIDEAGDYELRAVATDAKGRTNKTTLRVSVYGKGQRPWFRPDAEPTVELIPDARSHAPGATAKLLIKSPFPHSVGLLAIDREGLIEYRPLSFDGPVSVEEIALPGEFVPNVHVMVGLTRGRISPEEAGAAPGDPDDLGRPMYAGGTLSLPIARTEHTLNVVVTPDKPAIEPGGQLDLTVRTTDATGAARAAELVIAVVDEGVLALQNYALPNPLEAIFTDRPAKAGNGSLIPLVLPRESKLQKLANAKGKAEGGASKRMMAAPAPAAAMDMAADKSSGPGAAPSLKARTLFASTAFFSAAVKTDAQGKATLQVKMPENLTRYRVMVVAVGEGERFGMGDGVVTLRKSVLVRPALPRFLNLGDAFQAAAVINNQTDTDLWIDAQARVANGTVDAKRQRVLVRAGEAKEVHFDAQAGTPGPSTWQLAAVALDGPRSSDAAELVVPVQVPATAEAFATYGVTEHSILQPVALPHDALPDFGGLEVSMSSTALTSLTDAVVYLHAYPYECVEQTASRIVPFIALKQAISDFHIPGAGTAAERDALVNSGIARILAKQRNDGGFGYWSDSRESYLYISAWVGEVFARAIASGYAVDPPAMERLKAFLTARLKAPRKDLGELEDYASQAMAARVLGELGKPAPEEVRRIYTHRKQLPLFGQAWLMEAAAVALSSTSPEVKELSRGLRNAAVEKAAGVHFAEGKTESLRLLMHSSARTDAIVLGAFIRVLEQDPLIPKIVRGLDASKRRGRWDTTQSNAWATLAMGDYYAAFEKTVPSFNAQLFVGQAFAGEARFEGRSAEVVSQKVPMAVALQQKDPALTLAKEGAGKLYYRLGLRYAPRAFALPAESQGFTVTRTYQPLEGAPGTVTTDADGHVHIQAGSEVRVTLQVVVTDRSSFVAVDDPLPAGLEPVNTAFLTSKSRRVQDAERNGSERTGGDWYWPIWNPFNHTELRDDRVALFADELAAGIYTHTYVARATTRGVFQVPPVRAFEMYAPESFGHSASTVVEVK